MATYEKITNIKGPAGEKGEPGPGTQLVVGTVTTLPEGAAATVELVGEAPYQVVNLGLPRGLSGAGAGATDAAIAGYFNTSGTQTLAAAKSGLAATFARSSYVRRIEEFLLPGETLDTTGTESIHVVRQRAINALNAQYLADASSPLGQRGYQIEYPAGHFRVAVEAVAKSGVGERGQGPTQTIFHVEGTQRFMAGGTDTVDINNVYADLQFTGFTIDCANVQKAGATYDGSIKGIFIRNLLRPRFERVHIVNTWATAFGLDYIRGGEFVDCFAKNTGRGHRANSIGKPTDDDHIGSGAGFGLGTGLYQDEPVRFVNCAAEDCYTSAFFTETVETVGATYRSRGHQFIGCSGKRSWYGFLDAGSEGAIVTGCNFSYNYLCGVGLDGTHAAPGAGVNGKITDTVIAYNGEGNSAAAGITIARTLFGGYTLDGNQIIGNFGPGIRFAKEDTDVYGPDVDLAIVNNMFIANQGAAIRAARPMPPRTKIEGNTSRRNTAALEIVNGPSTSYTSADVRVRFNDFAETSTISQSLPNVIVTNNIGISSTVPAALQVTPDPANPGKVTLQWTPPIEPPDDYRIEWQNAITGAWTVVAHGNTTPVHVITGLPLFMKIQIRVAGIVGGVVGSYAPTQSVKMIPAPYAADFFNGADGLLVAAADGATTLAWNDRDAGAWSRLSGSARPTVNYANSVRKALTLDAGAADGAVQVTYAKAPPVATDISTSGLIIRYVDANNYVVLDMGSAGTWQLRKRVAGGYSSISGGTIAPAAVGDVVLVQFSGNTYIVTIGDRTPVQFTDGGGSLVTATNRGLLQAGANVSGGGSPMKWDDFKTWNVFQ